MNTEGLTWLRKHVKHADRQLVELTEQRDNARNERDDARDKRDEAYEEAEQAEVELGLLKEQVEFLADEPMPGRAVLNELLEETCERGLARGLAANSPEMKWLRSLIDRP